MDWRQRPVPDRASIVAGAARKLRANAEEYAQYLTLEMGKLIAEARAEVSLAADILDYYADRAETYLKTVAVGAPGNTVETLPLGIILGVEPWNFPYYQLARVVGPQLMVGNVVIIKHASNVPQSALAFARLFESDQVPAGVYSNVFASNDQVARLIDDDRIRGVTVTGSERAGAAVCRARRAQPQEIPDGVGWQRPVHRLGGCPTRGGARQRIVGPDEQHRSELRRGKAVHRGGQGARRRVPGRHRSSA